MRTAHTTLLVPLDTSSHAETILAPAADLAQALGGRLTLLHVITPPTSLVAVAAPALAQPDAPQRHADELRADAHRYLSAIALRLQALGIPVDTVVRSEADVGGAILAEAERRSAVAIALTPNNVTGPRRWLLRSVTEQVRRATPVPLLLGFSVGLPRLVPPQPIRRILLPIAGQPTAEVLDTARALGAISGARILLAAILPDAALPSASPYSTTHELIALDSTAAALRAAGLTVETTVRSGALPGTIARLCGDYRITLVVMAAAECDVPEWRRQTRTRRTAFHGALFLVPAPPAHQSRAVDVAHGVAEISAG